MKSPAFAADSSARYQARFSGHRDGRQDQPYARIRNYIRRGAGLPTTGTAILVYPERPSEFEPWFDIPAGPWSCAELHCRGRRGRDSRAAGLRGSRGDQDRKLRLPWFIRKIFDQMPCRSIQRSARTGRQPCRSRTGTVPEIHPSSLRNGRADGVGPVRNQWARAYCRQRRSSRCPACRYQTADCRRSIRDSPALQPRPRTAAARGACRN